MDRLKFRVWDGSKYIKREDEYFLGVDGSLYEATGSGENKYLEIHSQKVEQSTGLKDKNGNLVYEGDVIEYKHREGGFTKYEIYFSPIEALYRAKSRRCSINCPIDADWLTSKEIIGNINENPELLEQ